MRSFLLVVVAAVALTAGPTGRARAEDKPPAPPAQEPDAFAARAPDAARACAAKLWNAAEDARKQSLFAWSLREARRVVEIDPDHKGARALLGYVKQGDVWVLDAVLAAKAPTTNFAGRFVTSEDAAKVERRWWKDVFPNARAAAGAIWATLGEELAKKGEKAAAAKAFERGVAVEPNQERSRKALGFFKWQGIWLTEAQVRTVEAACSPQIVTTDSPVEKAFGVQLFKVETPHFRVESRLPPERLQDFARALETACAVHLVTMGREPTAAIFPSRIRMVVCDSEAEWNTWIDKFVPRNKDFYRKLEGAWGDNWQYGMRPPGDGLDETRRDHLVHRAIHVADFFALDVFWPSWVDEGLAHLTTLRVQGMTRTWCLAPSPSEYAKLDGGGGATGRASWIEESEMRASMRAAVVANDELPLRTLVSQPFPQLGFQGAMKAWSILEFWQDDDPATFRALLPKFKGAKDPAAMVEAHFGKALETIDEDWRRWVLRMY